MTDRNAADAHGQVLVGPHELPGFLDVPDDPSGLVIFAHGSGSSRRSTRNRLVAAELNRAGLATLLFDLLSADEETDRSNVFDIPLLAGRLGDACTWSRRQPTIGGLPLGLFGASTGAGAALWTAAEAGSEVSAIVSRGGRPDLAAGRLGAVAAPTLLIVGGNDPAVLAANRLAEAQLATECELAVIEGATHLFEESGALTAVARLATEWFIRHL